MRPNVPFFDPTREYEELRERLDETIAAVVAGGRYILGPTVEAFEEAIASYLGVEYAIGVNSGTDALKLTLEALGVGPGGEVITSPFTFWSTAGVIAQLGARPVFADILPDTFNLDPAAVEAAVSPRTTTLVPVHLFGQMAEMEALTGIAEKHGLAIVEDAAQAIGATRTAPAPGVATDEADRADHTEAEGRKAGSLGLAGCFSFYPTKNLGAMGDGGLITTSDIELARRLERLRNHGRTGTYRHAEIGHNSRLDAVQAAVLLAKLPFLDQWNERRRDHAAAYDAALAASEAFRPPVVGEGNRHVFHQYTVRCRERETVLRRLDDTGIGHAIYYPIPLHLQEALGRLGHREGDFPQAETAAREVVSLPVYPGLTPSERERVIEALLGG